jgi:predicted nucleic acid-binding protein
MKLVVDASVALKWFFRERTDESDTPAALGILQGHVERRHELLQPPHFMAEMCAVLAREAPRTMDENLRDLLDLAMPMRDDPPIYWRAMQLSRALGHHLFDTLYHALALETDGAMLVTADEAYVRKARGFGRVAPLSTWAVGR